MVSNENAGVDKLITFGQMALERGWYDQAREYFEQALDLAPSNREALDGLVQAILSDRTITTVEPTQDGPVEPLHRVERKPKSPHHQESENASEVRGVSLLPVAEMQDQSSPPIDVLNLSIRSYNCLQRSDLRTVAQVATLSDEELSAIRQLGPKTLAEIREKLAAYLSEHPLPNEAEQSPPEPAAQEVEPLPPQPPSPPLDLIPLGVLELSIRPYNALMRNDITTVEQLARMSDEQIKSVRNTGPKSLAEIKDKLKAYLAIHPLPTKSVSLAGESKPSPPPPPLADPKLLDSAQEKGIPLDKISVERLALPEWLQGSVQAANIQTIGELARQPRDKRVPLMGIIQRLNRYLTWLAEQDETAWANEVAGRGISPLYRLDLGETSLEALMEKWLSPLKNRERQVIRWRYGLEGEELTLEETGEYLDVTRSRVGQIQNKALSALKKSRRRPIIRLLGELLVYLLEQAGGMINEPQVEAALRRELVIGNVNPVGVARLTFKLDANVKQFREAKAWGLRSYPLDEVKRVQARLARVLEEEHVPLSIDEVIARFKSTQFYRNRQDALNDSFILACLRVHPRIEISDGMCALTKWLGKRLHEIIHALRELGKPAHYSEIAKTINAALPPKRHIADRTVHNRLTQRPELFVWVGLRGTYGLREWGLEQAPFYEDALAQILQQAGHPLTFQKILAEMPMLRPYYEESSIVLTLGTNERFRPFPGNTFGLTEWTEDAVTTEDYRLKRLFEGVEVASSPGPRPRLTETLNSVDSFIVRARERLSDER